MWKKMEGEKPDMWRTVLIGHGEQNVTNQNVLFILTFNCPIKGVVMYHEGFLIIIL